MPGHRSRHASTNLNATEAKLKKQMYGRNSKNLTLADDDTIKRKPFDVNNFGEEQNNNVFKTVDNSDKKPALQVAFQEGSSTSRHFRNNAINLMSPTAVSKLNSTGQTPSQRMAGNKRLQESLDMRIEEFDNNLFASPQRRAPGTNHKTPQRVRLNYEDKMREELALFQDAAKRANTTLNGKIAADGGTQLPSINSDDQRKILN